jgi:hypothetical protein
MSKAPNIEQNRADGVAQVLPSKCEALSSNISTTTNTPILYNSVMVDICHSIVQIHSSRLNPNANYGLWVITMCQYRLQQTSHMGDINNGRSYSYVVIEDI